MKRTPKRSRIRVAPTDEQRLLAGLERWAATGDILALRTRAFILLLWDGASRTSAALALNVEEVVKDPRAQRVTIAEQVTQRACEGTRYRERQFHLSTRARAALADYVRAARKAGLLLSGSFKGPLFVGTGRFAGKRLSARSAIHWWEEFQNTHELGCSELYKLDDIVYTARLEFMGAAGGDSSLLAEHSGISRRWAAEYAESQLTPQEVIKKLNKSR